MTWFSLVVCEPWGVLALGLFSYANIQDAARYMPDHLADDNAAIPWTIEGS